jgi:ferrochelatase
MKARPNRLAIVIFNLGGPDGPAAVRPFLFNLFSDPNILLMPAPLRWIAARLLSTLRAPKTRRIYDSIGGKSVLLEETKAQAAALQAAATDLADDVRVFVFMRYWHPFPSEAVAQVKDFAPDRVVLLPLYPQFSTTTTGTSVAAFRGEAARQGLTAPIHDLCCYPRDEGFVGAVAEMVASAHRNTIGPRPRVIFCAHSLPEKTIAAGDPYQSQMEETAALIAQRTGIAGLDWTLSYQSRLGPVKWIGPSLVSEIRRAGVDKVPVIVVPISFVSEHVETLVELDRDMREIAAAVGVPGFVRLPAVRTHTAYISSLVRLTAAVLDRGLSVCSAGGVRTCASRHGKCPFPGQSAAESPAQLRPAAVERHAPKASAAAA